MKISELRNLEIPNENLQNKINIFKTRKKLPIISQLKMSFIDFSIASVLRVIFGVATFRILMFNLPSVFSTQIVDARQRQDTQAILTLVVVHNIHWYIIIAIILGFFCGSLYYIIMCAYSSFGTLGMKWAKLFIQTKRRQKPSILQAFLWYYTKTMYPLLLIIASIIFLLKGFNAPFIITAILALFFSNALVLVFGIQPIYEKISGMKIAKQ